MMILWCKMMIFWWNSRHNATQLRVNKTAQKPPRQPKQSKFNQAGDCTLKTTDYVLTNDGFCTDKRWIAIAELLTNLLPAGELFHLMDEFVFEMMNFVLAWWILYRPNNNTTRSQSRSEDKMGEKEREKRSQSSLIFLSKGLHFPIEEWLHFDLFSENIYFLSQVRSVCPSPVQGKMMNFWIINDEFCIENDGFCINNDGFCIKNDEFCIKMIIARTRTLLREIKTSTGRPSIGISQWWAEKSWFLEQNDPFCTANDWVCLCKCCRGRMGSRAQSVRWARRNQ